MRWSRPPENFEEDHEARRPFDRCSSLAARAQPGDRRGLRPSRGDGPARAGGLSCELGRSLGYAVSGRLLVFAKPLGPADKRPVTAVNMDQIDTHATAIAAQEVAHLEPGATIELDADVTAFPTPSRSSSPAATPCRRCSTATTATITLDAALAISRAELWRWTCRAAQPSS